MMRVLLVKTSSLGDVLHALPALTDAMRAIPDIRFDWVVEEAFQEIPGWHPAVDRVIPVALRRWRKAPLRAVRCGEWRRFRAQVQERSYDLVLDSQGLIKSAWLAFQARGKRVGFDRASAREPLATLFYDCAHRVDRNQHAITRQRDLFAQALAYPLPDTAADSHLRLQWTPDRVQPYVVLLHGTTWPSKEWPELNWVALAKLALADGYAVRIPWGNDGEKARAERIAQTGGGEVLPRQSLADMARVLASASRVIGVDSGLAHLAAAVGVPAVTLYGPTDATRTGAVGKMQLNLQGEAECAPCLEKTCKKARQVCWDTNLPEVVWCKAVKH